MQLEANENGVPNSSRYSSPKHTETIEVLFVKNLFYNSLYYQLKGVYQKSKNNTQKNKSQTKHQLNVYIAWFDINPIPHTASEQSDRFNSMNQPCWDQSIKK